MGGNSGPRSRGLNGLCHYPYNLRLLTEPQLSLLEKRMLAVIEMGTKEVWVFGIKP